MRTVPAVVDRLGSQFGSACQREAPVWWAALQCPRARWGFGACHPHHQPDPGRTQPRRILQVEVRVSSKIILRLQQLNIYKLLMKGISYT